MLTTKNWAALPLITAMALVSAALLSGCSSSGPRLLLEGERLIKEQKYSRAIETLERAVSLLPNHPQSWNHLGLAYHHAGRANDALKAYQQALRYDPDLVQVRFNMGVLYLEQKVADRAAHELTTYTILRPNEHLGWVKLGAAQLQLRQFEAAERSFQQALQLNHKLPEAYNGLGVVQAQKQRPRDAFQQFNRALQLQPSYAPALLNLGILYDVYLINRPLALEKYREYLEIEPAPPEYPRVAAAARRLEDLLQPAPEPPPQAARAPEPEPQRVRTPDPEPPRPPEKQVAQAPPKPAPQPTPEPEEIEPRPAEEKKPPPSVVTPEKPAPAQPEPAKPPVETVTIPPPPPVKAFPPAQPPPAEEAPPQIAEAPPVQPAPPNGSPPGAAGPLVLSTSPLAGKFPRYRFRHLPMPIPGDRIQAEEKFFHALEAHQRRRIPTAIQGYREAIQLDPSYFEAFFNLGLAAYEMKDFSTAVSAYEVALSINPTSVNARYNFALALHQANYTLDAAHELEKLVADHPREIRAHFSLGSWHAQHLGRPDLARHHYRKVLELNPNHPQGREIRSWLMSNQ
jgi:tetratricopeptide (TPR) repeat protein